MLNKEVFELLEVSRDAFATNKGFYYQYLVTLKKWLLNFIDDSDTVLYTEVNEDIMEIGGKLIFTQLKCYSQNLSLNSKEIKKSLYNFYILFLKNIDIKQSLVFETNTSIKTKDSLLKKWVSELPTLTIETKQICCRRICSILTDEFKKERLKFLQKAANDKDKIKLVNFSFDALASSLSEEVIMLFVESISFGFSNKTPDDAINEILVEIHTSFSNEKFKNRPIDILFDALLSEIYRKSQDRNTENRKLDRNILLAILQRKDDEIIDFIDSKVLDLFGGRIQFLHHAIEDLYKKGKSTSHRIENIENILKQSKDGVKIAKDLTLLPRVAGEIIGRLDDIEKINVLLDNSMHLSIRAAGGIGKSTLAKLYIDKKYEYYDHIIWINIESGLKRSIAFNQELIHNLHIDFSNDDELEKRFQKIVHSMNLIEGNNLIVVNDYYESIQTLEPLLFLKSWKVLITTRGAIDTIREYKLEKLDFNSVVSVFKRHNSTVEISDDLLTEFFDLIGYNTLFVELAAKTITNSLDLTLQTFLTHLKDQQLDGEELDINIAHIDNSNRNPIIWHLKNLFSLSNLTGSEKWFMEFFALLPTENILISDLISWCGKEYETKNKTTFINVINSLQDKGWLERTGNVFSIHKLVSESILYHSRESNNPFLFVGQHIGWLIARFTEGHRSNPMEALRFLRYGESILNKIKEPFRGGIYQPLLLLENEVLNVFNMQLLGMNNSERWSNLLGRATCYLPAKEPLIGSILSNYALALGNEKRYKEAVVNFKLSINILKKHLPHTLEHLMLAMNNLSTCYLDLDDLGASMEIFKDAMQIRKANNHYSNQSVALSFYTLARANQKVNNHEKAIQLFKEAIKEHLNLNVQQRNNLYLIMMYHNMVYSIIMVGRGKEAISFQEKAVELIKKFGLMEKTQYNLIVKTLVLIYKAEGFTDKAEELELSIKTRLDVTI